VLGWSAQSYHALALSDSGALMIPIPPIHSRCLRQGRQRQWQLVIVNALDDVMRRRRRGSFALAYVATGAAPLLVHIRTFW